MEKPADRDAHVGHVHTSHVHTSHVHAPHPDHAPHSDVPPADDTGGPGTRGPDARASDIGSGQGTPPWLSASLNHCTRCGGRLRHGPVVGEDRDRLACEDCGHISYVNPRLVVTTIPITDDGRVLLIRRGIEPGKGSWAQPGGFLEVDETVAEGARREMLEETGLEVEVGEIIGLYTRLEAAVVVVAFEARITGGTPTITPEAMEIGIFAPDELPWPGIAFTTTIWALRDWLARRHPAVPLDEPGLYR